jgi:HAD superfamily hydrolase (TIGR01509 family)
MIRGIIFDFDGLILDTESVVHQSWQELFQSQGVDLSLSTWAEFIGTAEVRFDLFDHLEEQLGYSVDRKKLSKVRYQRGLNLIAQQPLLPGVKEYLEQAKALNLKIGLASSSPCAWVTGHLERFGLIGYFDCIMAADDVTITKPDPGLYHLTLDSLGLSADQAIALEDSPNGIRAAKQAGLFVVAVPNIITRHLDLDQADLQIASMEDLALVDLIVIAESKIASNPTSRQQ